MDLHNLKPAKGSIKTRRRIGRGQGSGMGETATRGFKGQKSRSGYSKKIGFEGGQQPLQRRIPRYGFNNINRKEFRGINLDTLQELADRKKITKIDLSVLVENGLASKNNLVKILARGELKSKIEIEAHAFSKSAITAITNAGSKHALISNKTQKPTSAKDKKPKPATNGFKNKARTKTEKEEITQT